MELSVAPKCRHWQLQGLNGWVGPSELEPFIFKAFPTTSPLPIRSIAQVIKVIRIIILMN